MSGRVFSNSTDRIMGLMDFVITEFHSLSVMEAATFFWKREQLVLFYLG